MTSTGIEINDLDGNPIAGGEEGGSAEDEKEARRLGCSPVLPASRHMTQFPDVPA